MLNGLGMMFMKLLTNRRRCLPTCAPIGAPTRSSAPRAMRSRASPRRTAAIIHLINSGACCLDANGPGGDESGEHLMKQWFDVTEADQKAIMAHTTWNYADLGYFRGGGYSSRFVTEYARCR